jgi:hypothetical protein
MNTTERIHPRTAFTHRLSRIGCFAILGVASVLSSAISAAASDGDPTLTREAASIIKDAGTIISQTPSASSAPLYVFEENHASLRGQIQIATMLTRLYKRDGLRAIGLEGSIKSGRPLPTKGFIQGNDPLARRDALRRMLQDGDIRATEYVGAVNPGLELWGLEKKEEYDVQPPEGVSASFRAVLAISTKLLSDDKLEQIVKLIQSEKVKEALEVMKSGHPWIREQLSVTNEDDVTLESLIKRQQSILRKADEVGVTLPGAIKSEMEQTIHFYEVAEIRSVTIASNMVLLASSYPGKPTALVVGSAHAARVMERLAADHINAALIKPLNFEGSADDPGMKAFENKNAGLLANDAPDTFGFYLNKLLGNKKARDDQHPPPTFIENPNRSRDALGAIQYASSVIAEAARAGKHIPDDIPAVLGPLPGGVSIDPKSFSQDGYDVVFCVVLTTPDNAKRRIWVRAGTSRPGALSAAENDMKLLAAADGEPPKEPPSDDKAIKNAGEQADPKKGESGKEGVENKSQKRADEAHLLLDIAAKYKAFSNEAEAKACPRLSTQ